MARSTRAVSPGCWYHVTQRGEQRQAVFFSGADRVFYLELLARHCKRYRVRVGAYCLMGNHIHLLMAPELPGGIEKVIRHTHGDYVHWCVLRRQASEPVWQGRPAACMVDEWSVWDAARYVELNPVRAGLVNHADEWPWSSAAAHATGCRADPLLDWGTWKAHWTPATWKTALRLDSRAATFAERIRFATATGQPLSVDTLRMAAIVAEPHPSVRPPKTLESGLAPTGRVAVEAAQAYATLGAPEERRRFPGNAPARIICIFKSVSYGECGENGQIHGNNLESGRGNSVP